MATINTTITITSNSSGATTSKGPMSPALSMTTKDALFVDRVESEIFPIPDIASPVVSTVIVDGSAHEGAGNGHTPGTDGCYMYIKNNQTSGSGLIYVGLLNDGERTDISGDSSASTRTMTLKAGEFAWFPYDYTGDIVVQSSVNDQTVEFWRFDRHTE